MSCRMTLISEPVSRIAGALRLLLTSTSISCSGKQKADGWCEKQSEVSSCFVVIHAADGEVCASSTGPTSYSLVLTRHTLSFSVTFLRMAGLTAKM